MKTEQQQRDKELFDKIASKYAKKDVVYSSRIPRENKIKMAVEGVIKEKGNLGRVIEIGCGIGASATYLNGFFEEYCGIDQSPELINKAIQFNASISNVEFLCADVKASTLPDSSADTIIAVGVLHHLTELDEVMTELKRIAKPGCYFIAIEPLATNPLIQFMRFIRKKVDKDYSNEQHFFLPKEIFTLMNHNGLNDVKLKYFGFFSNPFSQVILDPQFIFVPLSRLFVFIDNWFLRHAQGLMQVSAWSMLIQVKMKK